MRMFWNLNWPPPATSAVFDVMSLLIIAEVPLSIRPPPATDALLPTIMLPLILRVPILSMPPPEYALLLILLFLIVIAASWFVFIAFGYMPLDALFEVVSATATVGLSTGITNAELHPVLKCVLCMDMLLGRRHCLRS